MRQRDTSFRRLAAGRRRKLAVIDGLLAQATRCAALRSALTGMMEEPDRPAGTTVTQRPTLYWQPSLCLILFSTAHQRRDVIKDDHLGVSNPRVDPGLSLRRRQIRKSKFGKIGKQNSEVRGRWRLLGKAVDNS